MMEIIKILCLFIAILFTISCLFRAHAKNDIAFHNMVMMSIGWTGFIYLQFIYK